jgi:[pyruvate, water dikinase]-phosphate phosphotransferase / [pyruvate, water dikinase] kinase
MNQHGAIYMLSDGTGETAATMVRAALVQYPEKDIEIFRYKNIRNEMQIGPIIEDAFAKRGLLVYTIVNPNMRNKIRELASGKGIPVIDLMGPMLSTLDAYLGVTNGHHTAGLLRVVDEMYFKRIEAIEYTVKHDDGKCLTELEKADVVLVGVSRTSKTPLSIFLSHKGWKVANIPLVLGAPIPEEVFKVDQRRVVGLIIDIDSLQRIRKSRLERFGQDPGGEYASVSHIIKEIEYAHELFKKNRRWPVLNVTDRALEETATEITKIVASRLGLPESVVI